MRRNGDGQYEQRGYRLVRLEGNKGGDPFTRWSTNERSCYDFAANEGVPSCIISDDKFVYTVQYDPCGTSESTPQGSGSSI